MAPHDNDRSHGTTRTIGVLALVAAMTTAVLVLRSPHSSSGADRQSPAAPVATSPRVAAGPFDSSPAAQWRDAAAAVTVPMATPQGDLSAAQVASALAAARAYVLAARTDEDVLAAHRLAGLQRRLQADFVHDLTARAALDQESLGATFLAPRNRLAAPVGAKGTLAATYSPASGIDPAEITVDVNVVWAYALDADYEVAPVSGGVVALHEKSQLDFIEVEPGKLAAPMLGASNVLFYDSDCGYFNQKMVGLPRVNDPDALPLTDPGVSRDQAFDPNRDIPPAHTCR